MPYSPRVSTSGQISVLVLLQEISKVLRKKYKMTAEMNE